MSYGATATCRQQVSFEEFVIKLPDQKFSGFFGRRFFSARDQDLLKQDGYKPCWNEQVTIGGKQLRVWVYRRNLKKDASDQRGCVAFFFRSCCCYSISPTIKHEHERDGWGLIVRFREVPPHVIKNQFMIQEGSLVVHDPTDHRHKYPYEEDFKNMQETTM
ncbi:MAG: hypothetical protein S4CHLAM45_02530 [Chlamydiales bacterium]|nr:hypothetical protein [Chlamydiales bacterium]MCH9619112.1 hypothetical protein [Chlamydiales bacterium]MCH9622374.1 hypothetical protein [Chlamydiales bacterium]